MGPDPARSSKRALARNKRKHHPIQKQLPTTRIRTTTKKREAVRTKAHLCARSINLPLLERVWLWTSMLEMSLIILVESSGENALVWYRSLPKRVSSVGPLLLSLVGGLAVTVAIMLTSDRLKRSWSFPDRPKRNRYLVCSFHQYNPHIRRLTRSLLVLVVFFIFVVWIGSFFRGVRITQPDENNLLVYALIFLIIGVPVGLPVVTTTTLAVGAAYLARRKAIVQKLTAIESLAGVDMLCSDKTGTLTANKLSLNDPYVAPDVDPNWFMAVAVLASSHKIKSLDPIDKVTIVGLKVGL